MKHPDRSAIKLIEILLGMGVSGRLYQRLRTELNLVYQISTINSLFEDTGYLCIKAICDPDKVSNIQDEVYTLWEDICMTDVSSEDLKKAKGYYKGTLRRHLETNAAIAGITGVEGLLNEVETIEQAVKRINRVSPKEIIQAANRYLKPKHSVTAIIGPKIE